MLAKYSFGRRIRPLASSGWSPPTRGSATVGVQAATAAFDQVAEDLVEHAAGEALHLMPGRAP